MSHSIYVEGTSNNYTHFCPKFYKILRLISFFIRSREPVFTHYVSVLFQFSFFSYWWEYTYRIILNRLKPENYTVYWWESSGGSRIPRREGRRPSRELHPHILPTFLKTPMKSSQIWSFSFIAEKPKTQLNLSPRVNFWRCWNFLIACFVFAGESLEPVRQKTQRKLSHTLHPLRPQEKRRRKKNQKRRWSSMIDASIVLFLFTKFVFRFWQMSFTISARNAGRCYRSS